MINSKKGGVSLHRSPGVCLAETYSSKELLSLLENDLKLNDFATAQMKLSLLTSANTIEANYKTFYNSYINYQQGTSTPSDSSALAALAYRCPGRDGVIVYQARALYNSMLNTYIAFEDNCPERKMSAATQENKAFPAVETYFVYPNPSKDQIFIAVSDKEIKSALTEITDITGKLVYTSEINFENLTGRLNLNLENGVYLIRIIDADNKATVQKIVINK